MTNFPLQIATDAEAVPPAPSQFQLRLGLACLAVVLGDWLFFQRTLGVSVAVFMAALAASQLMLSERVRRRAPKAMVILLIAFIPLIEAVGFLSLAIATVGLALFMTWTAGSERQLRKAGASAAALLAMGPFQLVPDLVRAYRQDSIGVRLSNLHGWVIPLGFCIVFAWLFASANPIIQAWLGYLNPLHLFSDLSVARIGVWVLLLVLSWPLIAPRLHSLPGLQRLMSATGKSAMPAVHGLFSPSAILRSLVLFNMIFAVQTMMDLGYLWGGVELPEGMSYAEYAHRGAYPLIATALLAAAFVLIAFRPDERRSPLVRGLVFLWVGQNVLLVISSILRLHLYVEIYSLTYLRVAAFIWMMLVAVGLVLIVVRIKLDRSNAWLIEANLTVLALVLYVCALVNFPAMIASYNVDHAISGTLSEPDTNYIISLGPDAIPALDRYAATLDAAPAGKLLNRIAGMAYMHARTMRDWRAWSFRGERLERYIEARRSGRRAGAPERPGHR